MDFASYQKDFPKAFAAVVEMPIIMRDRMQKSTTLMLWLFSVSAPGSPLPPSSANVGGASAH